MATSTGAVPRRDDILKAVREAKPLLDAFGVSQVSLFGSFARDEAHEDSDVDLLVEFSRPIGMFGFVRLQRELSERLGRKVELGRDRQDRRIRSGPYVRAVQSGSEERRRGRSQSRNHRRDRPASRRQLEDLPQHVRWADISRMRNVLIHEYFGVDLTIIWQTLTDDLPVLRSELEGLLR